MRFFHAGGNQGPAPVGPGHKPLGWGDAMAITPSHVRPLFFAFMLVPTVLLSQEPAYCGDLRAQHATIPDARRPTFEDWITATWPSGRFNVCIGKPVPQGVQAGPPPRAQPVLTNREKRYCYNIAITHGHMRASPAKTADRDAWGRMRCRAFLGRGLPTRPLPPDEEERYTDALLRLPPPQGAGNAI